ncbi:xanthine dehydrogenase family protein subunit M [Pseudanabaena sp. FACHB-2040]|uniref:FAD binding domain-containing protein n=1 Tax=Pseudanabaena sp. FACHB-2040 TaxID=2692859 RepID=UPI0016831006|nr:xanthine dehydrogenase family protein subunit M [Pseudanabaena sp. FACHB-2040]MBD2261174.1 xanthine dehydrogenase family protein subunit M [Pseudanabaena sp. FACHB-2040]
MHPFSFSQAEHVDVAIASLNISGAKVIAGGTNLVDLIRIGVETPNQLIDINQLPLAAVEETSQGVRINALARMSAVADATLVRDRYPMVSQALLNSASPQLRNMASIGGNLMQRTRCPYFRDQAFPCNKRQPGTGCPAIEGENRMHAILGTSRQCIATHPSDLAVALVALDAVVQLRGPDGERSIPIASFHLLPGDTPERETVLQPGELIIAVEVPASDAATQSHYLKVRDRASYEFALVSAAVGLDVDQGIVQSARVALGGVGTKPWRAYQAETVLQGQSISDETFTAAAEAALQGAIPREHNAFKIELAKRTLVRALSTVAQTGGRA